MQLNNADKKQAVPVRLLLAACYDKLQTLLSDIADTYSQRVPVDVPGTAHH